MDTISHFCLGSCHHQHLDGQAQDSILTVSENNIRAAEELTRAYQGVARRFIMISCTYNVTEASLKTSFSSVINIAGVCHAETS